MDVAESSDGKFLAGRGGIYSGVWMLAGVEGIIGAEEKADPLVVRRRMGKAASGMWH